MAISFGISASLMRIKDSVMIISGIITGLIMVGISNRHFGGITGDVLGAMNELARMASLITIVAIAK